MNKPRFLAAMRAIQSLLLAIVLSLGGLPAAAIAEVGEEVAAAQGQSEEEAASESAEGASESAEGASATEHAPAPASEPAPATEPEPEPSPAPANAQADSSDASNEGDVASADTLLSQAQAIADAIRQGLGQDEVADTICERAYTAVAAELLGEDDILASPADASRAMALVLSELGLTCVEVVDKSGAASWNMVQIGEAWYHLDAWSAAMAWLDSLEAEEAPRDWLLVGDETLRSLGASAWTLQDGAPAPEAARDYAWPASTDPAEVEEPEQTDAQGEKAAQTIALEQTSYDKVVGDAAFSLGATTTGDGALTYLSANAAVASVDDAGTVSVVGAGTTTITVQAAETDSYEQASATVTVTVSKRANTLAAKAKQSSLTLKYNPAKTQQTSANITVSKAQGDISYANVSKKATSKKFSVNKSTGAVSVPKATAAGTYPTIVRVTAAGNSGYAKGSKDVSFNIVVAPASLSGATVAPMANQPYTGKAITPKPVVKLAGVTLKASRDYTLKYANNTKAGTATVTIAGKGNYTGTKKASFKIVAPSVSYRTHIQTYGDQSWKKDGQTSGSTGKSKRLEGIWIKLANQPTSGSIQYRTHVQGIGWQGWKSDGAMSGTSGQQRRLEAIQIKLTGAMASRYDVYYRVHSQTYGWMGWAKNGATSGTAGQSKRLEGIQIVLVTKNGAAPSKSGQNTAKAFVGNESIALSAHVQRVGWTAAVGNGQVAGTVGQGLRVEALRASLNGASVPGAVELRSHVQGDGWTGWSEGSTGTTNRGLRLQALQMRLSGEAASVYDLYYRVHVQGVGWLAWASEGQVAGASKLGLRVEAVQAVLVRQGGSKPSGDSAYPLPELKPIDVDYATYVQGSGWQNPVSNGKTSGTAGQGLRTEGIKVSLSGEYVPGGVTYRTYMQGSGWQPWKANGEDAGSPGQNLRMEAMEIKLTGTAAGMYNIWYRAHVQGIGWMGWACNGASAGTSNMRRRVEAIEVCLRSRNAGAPGSTSEPYRMGDVCEGLKVASGAGELTTFGGYSANGDVVSQLSSAVGAIHNSGYQVGFIMMDINTQKGIAYNCDQVFYGASSIKAPYIASVVDKYPDVLNRYAYDIHQTLIYSWDYNYKQVYYAYGTEPMRAWCSASGARSSICDALPWADFSARDLALLWGQNYKLFTSSSAGETYGSWCEEPETCAIHTVLGGRYRTRSKAGWIADGGKYNVTNDGGIVYADNGPYVVAIMSSIPAQMNMLNNLVSAIDAAHATM